jgi:hypothetical protein
LGQQPPCLWGYSGLDTLVRRAEQVYQLPVYAFFILDPVFAAFACVWTLTGGTGSSRRWPSG